MTKGKCDLNISQTEAVKLLCSVFDTLDDWRHLPAYQLERRVDVFFGLMLPEMIEDEFGLSRDPSNPMVVIPEFPLHKGLVGLSEKGPKDNQSVNVDLRYFVPDVKIASS